MKRFLTAGVACLAIQKATTATAGSTHETSRSTGPWTKLSLLQ